MNRISLLVACCFWFSMAVVRAQQGGIEIGLHAGVTHNTLSTDNGPRAFTAHYPMRGMQIGLPVRYQLKPWLGVQTELSYVQKNYSVRRSGFFEGIGYDIRNAYLQVPLLAHFSFGGNRLRGFLHLGAFGGYWLNSRQVGRSIDLFSPEFELQDGELLGRYIDITTPYSYNERVAFDSRRDRRFEFGLLSGVGVAYQITDKYKLFTEIRYQYSLTDLQKSYMINQIPRYNNTMGVQLGVLYPLTNR